MKRLYPLRLLVALAVLSLLATASRAQDPPDVLGHFRLIPRFSTLHQTGGIAGLDLRYRLLGEYDFRQPFVVEHAARFENAEIWGSQISDVPVPAVAIDVDEILNLEGLKGERLPVMAPFDVYHMKGETSDGSSVNLLAAVLGPWMYVRGGTEPPPGSADFFEYQVKWLARSRPFADVNGDGVVDAADLVILRKTGASDAGFSGQEDGTAGIGLADWAQQFGETVPNLIAFDAAMSAAMASVAGGAVPEPAALSLAIIGCFVMSCVRRRAG